MAGDVAKYRETMVEDIAESDEALMEKYLDTGELSVEDMRAGLKKGVLERGIIPVACGSALKHMGIAPLIESIVTILPSPVDSGPVSGKKPGTDEEDDLRIPEESAPFSAMVFKTIADPYAGRLTLFRVFSGTVGSDSTFYNASRKISERFGNIFFLKAKIRNLSIPLSYQVTSLQWQS